MGLLGRIHDETETTIVLATHGGDLVGRGTCHLVMSDGRALAATVPSSRE